MRGSQELEGISLPCFMQPSLMMAIACRLVECLAQSAVPQAMGKLVEGDFDQEDEDEVEGKEEGERGGAGGNRLVAFCWCYGCGFLHRGELRKERKAAD